HGDIVGKTGGGGHNFVEICGNGDHPLQRFLEILGGAEIVERENEGGACSQFLNLFGLGALSGLQLNINQLTAAVGRLGQNLELGGNRSTELAPAGYPPAGRDG